MKRQITNEVGITLVALTVTIIILLIISGVSITALTQTNLFTNARKAKSTAENVQIDENTTLTKYENQIIEITGNRDTVTIDKEFYTLLKNNSIYTDNETIIGKWTDGKNLYRKIYHRDLITSGDTYLESNVSEIYPVKIDITYQQSDNSFVPSTGNVTLWYNTNMNYLLPTIVGMVSLVILGVGVFVIKKKVIDNK